MEHINEGHMNEVQSVFRTKFAPLIIFLSGLVVFGNTLHHQFALNDLAHIVNNSAIKDLGQAWIAFFEPTFAADVYRPVYALSYILTYHFAGLAPVAYHATNILLHALISVFVYFLILRVTRPKLAFLAAFLFAIHPVHIEAVANISGRTELLCHFFGLWTLFLALNISQKDCSGVLFKYLLLSLLFALALFSNETALCYLLLIPLTYFFQTQRPKASGAFWGAYVVLGATTFFYLLCRINVLEVAFGGTAAVTYIDNPLIGLGWIDRAANAVILLGKYVALVFIPVRLSADYSFAHIAPVTNFFGAEVGTSLLLITVFVLVGLANLRTKSKHGFFMLWFFFSLLMSSNLLFPIETIFAERIVYISSLGVLGIFSILVYRIESGLVRSTVVSFIVVTFGFLTVIVNESWNNNTTLFIRQRLTSPDSAKTRLGYGIALRNLGHLERAKAEVLAAHKIYPQYVDAAFGMAILYLEENKMEEAESWLKKTLKLNPDHLAALNALGGVYFSLKQHGAAKKAFQSAIRADADNFPAKLGLLAIYILKQELGEARILRDELVEQHPDSPELKRLSKLLNGALRPGNYI
ncbi:tetratricopeptide repeat protein [Oligoflexia bacterium]|nr:tetratricopeptide repeat protein [Oligoflexia bacterium]